MNLHDDVIPELRPCAKFTYTLRLSLTINSTADKSLVNMYCMHRIMWPQSPACMYREIPIASLPSAPHGLCNVQHSYCTPDSTSQPSRFFPEEFSHPVEAKPESADLGGRHPRASGSRPGRLVYPRTGSATN